MDRWMGWDGSGRSGGWVDGWKRTNKASKIGEMKKKM